MTTRQIEGYDVPQEAVDAVRLAIGQHCPSSVGGEELSDMVDGAIAAVLPFFVPKERKL